MIVHERSPSSILYFNPEKGFLKLEKFFRIKKKKKKISVKKFLSMKKFLYKEKFPKPENVSWV